MTLGRTGQRTIGCRRHGWAQKLTWKRKTTDHAKLWDPECHFFQSTSHQKDPCSTCVMSLKKENFISVFFCFKKKETKHIFDLRKHFLNWKPHAGYATGANPKRKKKKKHIKETRDKQNRKIKKGKTEMRCFLKPFLDHFLPPDGFVSIQIQMVVWHVNNLDRWPLFISPPGFLLYPRHAIHVLEYGSKKSSIVTQISTRFLVNFVFCCFLCFLICLFHVL